MEYYYREIEKKWQQFWAKQKSFSTEDFQNTQKPNYYVLDMFPYPSGAGLHVGHPLGYIASDIVSRYKRHKGYNVLHPMGYDSFGLPAEQYAIETGQHPAITTETNIKRYRDQLDKVGFSFDWDKEVRTSNPNYYKWTQWIFIELFNSYYCKDTQQARPIDELIEVFEQEGNININAETSYNGTFGFEEWKQFSEPQKATILLQYRLTYLAEAEVNWCPALGTVLANDEVINGVSERGGHPIIRKKMTQWMMRITAYAERLLQDLGTIDWPEPIKESQRNWIGKSKGAIVNFPIISKEITSQSIKISPFGNMGIPIFTTRPDTIFGVAFMTLAPEHPMVQEIVTEEQKEAVENYILETAKRSERDRMADVKTISGVFTGAYAIHPFTEEKIPIWIGDYVLASYGTGAVMAVPSGDDRDYAFANHFNIPYINIFNKGISEKAYTEKGNFSLQNSDFLNGMDYEQATEIIIKALEAQNLGIGKINYRLRDAVFSRQRYWGEPIPIYFKNDIPQTIPLEYLPLELPEIEKYLPTEEGEPPLGRATHWAWSTLENKVVSNTLVDNQFVFPLELNTMPGWAGSSWYFNRYMDAKNTQEAFSKEANSFWQQVDLYLGGSEHATGHLLYARFWQKFLYDLGYVSHVEFAKKLINQGMILGNSAFVYKNISENIFYSSNHIQVENVVKIHVDISLINEANNELAIEKFRAWREEYKNAKFITEDDGKFYVSREVEKMSKSKYNVVNPDVICEEFGADTLRMYEMFLGPIEQSKPWNTQGLTGVNGFLRKFWRLAIAAIKNPVNEEPTQEELKLLHQLIKKVTEDIENFSFNTSISQFMIVANELTKIGCKNHTIIKSLCLLISPFAPHIAEEIWSKFNPELYQKESYKGISYEPFPVFNPEYLVSNSKEYPVSFNGKMRFKLELPLGLSKEEVQKIVIEDERTQKELLGKTPKNFIFVEGKIINIVG